MKNINNHMDIGTPIQEKVFCDFCGDEYREKDLSEDITGRMLCNTCITNLDLEEEVYGKTQ